jgi:putative aldouronate transport system permease protein
MAETGKIKTVKKRDIKKVLYNQRYLLLMSIPFLVWLAVFRFGPMWGWIYAFQNFNPAKGVFGSDWVGLANFKRFFETAEALRATRNTVIIATANLILHNLMPVIFALFLNEIRNKAYKRTIQSISYLPHFVSFVVVANIFTTLLSRNGVVNELFIKLGIFDEPVMFWAEGKLFWLLIPLINIWKELGWGAIIYLAAISGINQELYDAANVDGCGRFRRIWHITIPGILPTVVILWILSAGGIFDAGFEQSYLLGNAANRDYSDVISTLTYRYGIRLGQFSFSTAVGLMKVLIGFALVAISNTIAKKLTDYSLW